MASSGAGGSGGNSILSKSSQRYDKIKLLGSGTFGEAWLVKSNQSGRHYVIKEMKMTQGISSKVLNLPKLPSLCFLYHIYSIIGE
jgi:serine/threonine protein kinase